jgi:signal transduction histidine kinase
MTHSRYGGLPTWALGLSLTVALAAVGILAYEAIGLDRSHRAAAEGVLRDYSAFAADQFSRVATERIRGLTRTILEPVACGPTPQKRLGLARGRTRTGEAMPAGACANPAAVEGYFEADRRTGRVVFAAAAIAGLVPAALASLPDAGPVGFALLPDHPEPMVVGYWTGNVPGAGTHVVGFIARAAILQPIFDRIVHREPLLPGSLADGSQHRDFLTIEVRDAHGRPLYQFGDAAAAFAVTRPIGRPGREMHARLSVSEAAAGRLIIGGVPRSRLPLLLSLLAVAVGLVTIGTWQVRREQRLARRQVDFVRSASHELRTPLAQIRLFAETLQAGRVRSWAEVVTSLAFVDQQARRLSRLVDNLLTVANGQRRRRAHLESLDLGAFVAEAVGAFQPVAAAHGQAVAVHLLDTCAVRADREWLAQVLLNLLDNASKYGPADQTITVRVSRLQDRARLVVEDEGPGVPARDRRRIFEPFVRLAREHEQRTGGTGIGLAVAADLVNAMNGTIRVEDAATGARFVVELAVADARELTDAA